MSNSILTTVSTKPLVPTLTAVAVSPVAPTTITAVTLPAVINPILDPISIPSPQPFNGPKYGFTFNGNNVTGMKVTYGTQTHTVGIPTNANFAVSTNGGLKSVTETIKGTKTTESLVYTAMSPTSSDFLLSSDTLTFNTPSTSPSKGWTQGVSFNLSNGTITGYFNSSTYNNKTYTSSLISPSSGIFTKNSDGSVTEILSQGNFVESITYVQPKDSTLYAVSIDKHTYIQPGQATTLLSVNSSNHLSLTFTGDSITGVSSIASNGAKTTKNIPSYASFMEVTPGKTNFVKEVISHNSSTSYVLFFQSSANSSYTEIAHGSGSVIDLVGVQTQLNQLPAAILALL
jgi:hypothetical protein